MPAVFLMAIFILFACATAGGAQDIFTSRGVRRDIPQYIDGKVWKTNSNEDTIDLHTALSEARRSGDNKLVIAILGRLGCDQDMLLEFFQGERFHSEALKIAESSYPKDSSLLADAHHNLASNLEFQKRYDSAIASYTKAREIRETAKPQDKSKVAIERFGVARCLYGEDKFEQSIAEYKLALQSATEANAIREKAEILQEFVLVLDSVRSPEVMKYSKECAVAHAEAEKLRPKMKYEFRGGSDMPPPKLTPQKPLKKSK